MMDFIEKLKYLCLSTLCILAFSGCKGLFGEKEEETPQTPSITFSETLEESREFDMGGGQFSLSFTSALDWKIVVEGNTKSVGWINVAPSSGKAGKAKVAITISENNGYEDRGAIVSINSGELSESFDIFQTAKETLDISASTVDIDCHSQTFDITITSNVEYQVQIADKCTSWLHLQENTKSVPADTILTFVADKNEEILPRDGSIVITDGKKTLTVKVNQKGDTSIQEREKEILHELREALSINNDDFEYWGQPWDPSIPVEQWARVKFENGYVT
ncbi:MAG: BACON domain-containing protein, partial [Candidatus Cryptobacteroides sp.]